LDGNVLTLAQCSVSFRNLLFRNIEENTEEDVAATVEVAETTVETVKEEDVEITVVGIAKVVVETIVAVMVETNTNSSSNNNFPETFSLLN